MKKYYICLMLVYVAFGFTSRAQSLNWLWHKGWAGSQANANAISADANGNVYVAGGYYGTLHVEGYIEPNAGSQDICLAKYDATGNVIWVKTATGRGNDIAYGVTVDAGGYIYIAGGFASDTLFLGTTMLINTSGGNQEAFIAKYDPSGNLVWVKGLQGNGARITGINSDPNSNIFVTGDFSGNLTVGNTILTNAGVFTARFDALGNGVWAHEAASPNAGVANSVHADINGNVYITGSFTQNEIIFGDSTLYVWQGGSNIFVVKYDFAGNLLWAESANVPGQAYANDYSTAIGTDSAGNAYITGEFSSTMVFGNQSVSSSSNTNSLFIARFDSTGNATWATATGEANAYTFGDGIAVDNKGNVLVTGYFNTPTIVFDTITLPLSGNGTGFVAAYNFEGHAIWAKSIGDPGGAQPNAIATDAYGNTYLTGQAGTLAFGTDTLFNPGVFVAKLGQGFPEATTDLSTGENAIGVFPVPSTGMVYFKEMKPGYRVEIYNLLGQLVQLSGVNNSNGSIDLSAVARAFIATG